MAYQDISGEIVSISSLLAGALLDEQYLYDRANSIVLLDATGDSCSEELDIEVILITGAAGTVILTDSAGNVVCKIRTTSGNPMFVLPLMRKVSGIVANTLTTAQHVYVYLKTR